MLPTYRQEATVKSVLAAVMFLMFSITVAGQETAELSTPPNGDNEHAEVLQWIAPVKISIDYHSPKVHNPTNNDRTGHIWGELVHYGIIDEGFGPTKGAPWRAGANESTSITFSNNVMVEGKDLKAGTYALFLDVEKNWALEVDFLQSLGLGKFPIRSPGRSSPRTGDARGRTLHRIPNLRVRRAPSGFCGGLPAVGEETYTLQDCSSECKWALCLENAPGSPVMGRVQLSGLADRRAILR
jgi:Protein of unknown function (DUF2911)